MVDDRRAAWGKRREAKPLDDAHLEELALTYVARFATSTAKLERYLRRKLRERGWVGERDPDLAALVGRFVDSGYVDDEAFARARSAGLLRRGYGQRRVTQALGEAGIAEPVRERVRPVEAELRRAALVLARKRRFGPFGAQATGGGQLDRALREKQIAAMLRAGHRLDSAREMVDAATPEAAERWAALHDDES